MITKATKKKSAPMKKIKEDLAKWVTKKMA
jgi:hypothetical protein